MSECIVNDTLVDSPVFFSGGIARLNGKRSYNFDIAEAFERGEIDLNGVVSRFKTWQARRSFLVFSRDVYSIGKGLKGKRIGSEYRVSRVCKRGDQLYGKRILMKFKRMEKVGKGMTFFDYHANTVKGSGLLVTLEYDRNVVDCAIAWHNVGSDLNRYLSCLRKYFGKVFDVRVFEAHESGYPHIHILLIFKHIFAGYRAWEDRKKRFIFRVKGKDYDVLKGAWFQGFSDYEMVNSFRGGLRYLSKYLSKSICVETANSKGLLTLALCWVFRKRAFGFSGNSVIKGFFDNDEISRFLHNSNYKSRFDFVFGYSGCVKTFSKWCLCGFVRHEGVKWDDLSQFSMDISLSQLVLLRSSPVDRRFDWYMVLSAQESVKSDHIESSVWKSASEYVNNDCFKTAQEIEGDFERLKELKDLFS